MNTGIHIVPFLRANSQMSASTISSSLEILLKKIRFGVSDPNLFLRSGSVWHVAEDGAEKCVVPRAAWLVIYQNDALTALLFLLIVLSGMILHMPRILKQTN